MHRPDPVPTPAGQAPLVVGLERAARGPVVARAQRASDIGVSKPAGGRLRRSRPVPPAYRGQLAEPAAWLEDRLRVGDAFAQGLDARF